MARRSAGVRLAFGAPVARPRAASARRGARDGSEAPQGCHHAQVSRGWGAPRAGVCPLHIFFRFEAPSVACSAPVARPWASSARHGAPHVSEIPLGCHRAQDWRARGARRAGVRPLHTFFCIATFLLHARKIAAFSLQGFVAHFFFGCTFFFAATFLCPLHETGFRCTLFVSGWAHLEGGVVVFPLFFKCLR